MLMIYYSEQQMTLYVRNSLTYENEFEMSMIGELTFFLGLQIKQSKDGIFINQSKYVNELLKKYKMDQAKHAKTPMATNEKIDLGREGKPISEKAYRGMIESLLYLTASRPDVMFSTWRCPRFQASLKESHLTCVKRIFRYLVRMENLGLWYPQGRDFSWTKLSLLALQEAEFCRSSIAEA